MDTESSYDEVKVNLSSSLYKKTWLTRDRHLLPVNGDQSGIDFGTHHSYDIFMIGLARYQNRYMKHDVCIANIAAHRSNTLSIGPTDTLTFDFCYIDVRPVLAADYAIRQYIKRGGHVLPSRWSLRRTLTLSILSSMTPSSAETDRVAVRW